MKSATTRQRSTARGRSAAPWVLAGVASALVLAGAVALAAPGEQAAREEMAASVWQRLGVVLGPAAQTERTRPAAEAASRGCLSCHGGIEPAHASAAVRLACVDCHGGDAGPARPAGSAPGDAGYEQAKDRAHVPPRFPEAWQRAGRRSAANPERSYTLLNREDPRFVRFVNPGDLRVAQQTCGPCHQPQVNAVLKSPMTTSAIFWAAAAYANGIVGLKSAVLGESYSPDGKAQAIVMRPPPSPQQVARGALAMVLPLPRWEIVQPGEYFRAFERGGFLQPSAFPEVGNPPPFDEPGRPDIRLSIRGPGTGLRISLALINLHKTRLNDPHLSFLGTNDHPGDFRSSGCSACHLVYANDRDPTHSGSWAEYGHRGRGASGDPALPHDEPGHPIRHQLTRAIPTSQCMVCHMHQPNAFVNTYLGYTMWDYETDGPELWWPRDEATGELVPEQRYPTPQQKRARLDRNPEGAAVRGLWGDREFLAETSELNDRLQHTQLADYHGHGWIFRAVYKRDRKGNLLDEAGAVVPFDDPQRFAKAVHLKDIHLEKGMHCVDCHFSQDVHGNGLLYGEYGNAIEIECQDCHGSVAAYTDLKTSGPAAPAGGNDLRRGQTSFGERRFYWRYDEPGGTGEHHDGDGQSAAGPVLRLYQRSMLEPGREWPVPQVKDTVNPAHPDYNERSDYAKTVHRDGSWEAGGTAAHDGDGGATPRGETSAADLDALAHQDSSMTCYACHSSWMTSCFGCHLPQEANVKSEMIRYEGLTTRNYASYNPQVVRTDVYLLGINGDVKGNKVAPVRSSSALVLSSTNANRQHFYMQQPPISTPGYSSQALNPHVPHTVRRVETKACDDCHLAQRGDNNAWMAQLLGLGTNTVNFVGRFAWVALGEEGLEAVGVTEWDEPQAVIGSYLHKVAYPDDYAAHQERGQKLTLAHHHHGGGGGGGVRSIQLRGEYLFTAKGEGGLEVFDVANVDNKDFSERIVTGPFSPLGHRTYVRTRYATAVALPTTMPVAPWRDPNPYPENDEQPMHPIYHYAFVSDRFEGLVMVNVDTLTDAEPRNNFFERALTFNPGGRLTGAENLTVAGNFVYVVGERGLTVVDCSRCTADDPRPEIVAEIGDIEAPKAVAVQFRYAFVAAEEGLVVVDVTDPRRPRVAARLPAAGPVESVYVARTYAYLAAGERGVVIVDVERPEEPFVDQVFDAGGELSDSRDVKVAATNASLFAYVADGHNGLAVLQLTSPETVPGYLGFSPRPAPRLIARYPVHGEALAVSKGLDRDRAVDESGNQVSIFNRIGARPLSLVEMQQLYLRDGEPFTAPTLEQYKEGQQP